MAEFTNRELKQIYEIVDTFGGNDKPGLTIKLKSLLRYSKNNIRCNTRTRIRNFAKIIYDDQKIV